MEPTEYRVTTHASTLNNCTSEKTERFTDRIMTRAEAEDWIRSLNPDYWKIWDYDSQYLAVAASGRLRGGDLDAFVSTTVFLYAEIGDEVREFLHWHLVGMSEYFAGQ